MSGIPAVLDSLQIPGADAPGTWVAIVLALTVAGVAHGAIGFGFPLISTPLVALITDVRTAVITTLLPNIVLNLISIVRGEQWLETLRRHWPVAAWVLVGTLVGTRVLAYAGPDVLKLLLAGLIFVYLLQPRDGGIAAVRTRAHPRLAQVVFGGLGGFFSGSVNVAVPPLLVYFSALELAPTAMTQALNLCFLVGRLTQIIALTATGQMGMSLVLLSVPLGALAVGTLLIGFRLQPRIPTAVFVRIVRGVLWTMATVLAGQVLFGYLRPILPLRSILPL